MCLSCGAIFSFLWLKSANDKTYPLAALLSIPNCYTSVYNNCRDVPLLKIYLCIWLGKNLWGKNIGQVLGCSFMQCIGFCTWYCSYPGAGECQTRSGFQLPEIFFSLPTTLPTLTSTSRNLFLSLSLLSPILRWIVYLISACLVCLLMINPIFSRYSCGDCNTNLGGWFGSCYCTARSWM